MSKPFVSIIILAAGEGRRFGGPKQLASFGGKSLLAHAGALISEIKNRHKSAALDIRSVLVIGAHASEMKERAAIDQWDQIVSSSNWREGMSASIRDGFQESIDFSGRRCLGALVSLVDQPLLDVRDVGSLLERGVEESVICCAEYPDSVGPPAFFPFKDMKRFTEEFEEKSDRLGGAKQFILTSQHHVMPVTGVLDDVDTPEDLARLNESGAPASRTVR